MRFYFLLLLFTSILFSSCGDDDSEECILQDDSFAFSVAENSSTGTQVGSVDISSASATTVSYTILSGNEQGVFVVDSNTGVITVADGSALDYEVVQDFVLSIRADSPSCTSATLDVVIQVANRNDYAYVDQFYSTVNVTKDVMYGEFADQNMWVYEPLDGGSTPRPLIVFVGGGAYNPSNLEVLSQLATRFAQSGYLVATIRYLSDPNDAMDPVERNIVSTHDVFAAIRFFRKDADTENIYNIDPNNIFVGGHGTGAFLALNANFIDDGDIPSIYQELFTSLGGVEGERGNPGYSSAFKAVAPFSGAIYDLNQIDAGENPIICVHGTQDIEVRCEEGQENGISSYGSCIIIPKANEEGIDSELVLIQGDHRAPQFCQDCFRAVLMFFKKYIE